MHSPSPAACFWRSGAYEAVRDGDWKLQVSRNPKRVWLFDLAKDPTERATCPPYGPTS